MSNNKNELIGFIDFDTPDIIIARIGLKAYEKKVEEYKAVISKEEKVIEETKEAALNIAVKLRESKLNDSAIKIILMDKFGNKQKKSATKNKVNTE